MTVDVDLRGQSGVAIPATHLISVKRLMLAAIVHAALYTTVGAWLEMFTTWALLSLGLAGVVVFGAVPRPNLASSSRIVLASVLAYLAASLLAGALLRVESAGFVLALAGFVGATSFAMAVNRVLFRTADFEMSLLVGVVTSASLVLSLEPLHASVVLFHASWCLLFSIGLVFACRIRGRIVRSNP